MQKIQNLQQVNKKPKQPHISISQKNLEILKGLGTCGMSYNEVLTDILEKILKQQGV